MVAIIAVLVAVMLPALAKVREMAKATLCLNYLQQIGVGYIAYKIDNHDRGCLGFTYGSENSRPGWSLPVPNPYTKWQGWYDARPHGLGYYLGRREGRDRMTFYCPNKYGDSGGYSVNVWLGYDTYLGDHVLDPLLTPMLTCGVGYDYAVWMQGGGLLPTFRYLCFPQNGVFGWRNGVTGYTKFGYEFLGMATYPHRGSANYLFFDGHAVNLPALGEVDYTDLDAMKIMLRKYRRMWSWTGNPDSRDLYMWDPDN